MLILKEYNCTNEPKTNQQRPHMHWTVWKNESFKTETYKYTVESKFQFKDSSKLWNCGQFSTGSTFNELRSPGFEKLFFNLKNDPGYKFLIFYSQFSTLNINPPPPPGQYSKLKMTSWSMYIVDQYPSLNTTPPDWLYCTIDTSNQP